MKPITRTLITVAATSLTLSTLAHAASLSLGADYMLRGVSIKERAKNIQSSSYYDQRLQAYLTTDLSKDVEATIRVQSITPWGLEGSTNPLATRYPDANGDVWVQNAFVRLPNIWKGNIVFTAGRQPIVWGDGQILSDDQLGFNAIRLNIRSPFRVLEFDIDAFTAKINEGIRGNRDTDLHGVLLGYDRDAFRWEFMGLFENNKNPGNYELGADSNPISAVSVERMIYGVRTISNLKDAYLKAAYYMQGGKVKRGAGGIDVDLGGSAYMIGLGGKQDTKKIGRFGAVLEFSEGSGDKISTPTKDEAFRPTFAGRWSGLERMGYGRYFSATLSDAYSPDNPFAQASASNDGLPEHTSGIQTAHLGMELTPWAAWTFMIDGYQYKAVRNLVGPKELGDEFDFTLEYRYSGLVTFRVSHNTFSPGDAFNSDLSRSASRSDFETEIKF